MTGKIKCVCCENLIDKAWELSKSFNLELTVCSDCAKGLDRCGKCNALLNPNNVDEMITGLCIECMPYISSFIKE